MAILSPDELRSDLEAQAAPLFGGFTAARLKLILESAVHYAEIAEKHQRYRETQNAARRRWRKRQARKKEGARGN